MSCTNNLKQLGLALHNYNSTFDHFPYESVVPQDRNRCNWLAHLLPYIEQPFTPVLTSPISPWGIPINPGPTTSTQYPTINAPSGSFIRNSAVPNTFVCKTFICPSDGNTISSDGTEGLTNYLGVNAPNTDQRDAWNTNNQGFFFYWGHFIDPGNTYGTKSQMSGPVWDAPTTIASITDGTSNTLAVGERPPVPNANAGQAASWCGGWSYNEVDSALGLPNTKIGWCAATDEQGNNCPSGKQWFQPPMVPQGSVCDGNHFWSRHPGGGNFVFADGSVHFLAYNISAAVQANLANRMDGNVIPGNAF
jgi:prepilin-type processing-associated H-X9-DG protein